MLGAVLPAVAAPAPPTIGLLAAQSEISVTRPPNGPIQVDPGIFVTATGGPFELAVSRDGYADPITISQVIGSHHVPLPGDILSGWFGLARFLHVTVRDDQGNVVKGSTETFCPNSYDPQRFGPGGPDQPTFPQFCSSNPFTLGMRWGIDQDWAANLFDFGRLRFRGPDGHYSVTVTIGDRYVRLFGIDPPAATATVGITVTTRRCASTCGRPDASGHVASSAPARVPLIAHPAPNAMPDLVPLPSSGISPSTRHGHDYLDFGATVWIGGASQLDVEGFRRPGTNVMDAYQYYYRNGHVVGRSHAGTMVYDNRQGHQHWHFEQFAQYGLVDVSNHTVVRSHKQGFCIAPTDSVDLLLPHAVQRPDLFGFFQCGTESSIWVRESLPLGWGDTYYQSVAGQSFDITDLPNGTYQVEVAVDPQGLLHQTDTTNDVSLRTVILGGTPGHRTVCVPAYDGIDQEGDC